jgi:uncharacterized protein
MERDADKKEQVFEVQSERVKVTGYSTLDRLRLFIDVERLSGASGILAREIEELIPDSVDREALDLRVIADIALGLRKTAKIENRRVVKGIEPEKGQDGKLLLMVKPFSGRGDVQLDEKGFANYAELHLFDNITEGTTVARLYPPKPGNDGKDIFGKPIVAEPGTETNPQLDKSLELVSPSGSDQAYSVIRSKVVGYLVEDKGALSISEELVIKGDLDVRMGNLRFIGKIVVTGDVKPGIEVRGERGVEIKGSVLRASIFSAGDIEIKGAVLGGGVSRIVCGGQLKVKSIAQSTVQVRGSAEVQKELRDSEVRSLTTVHLSQGQVIGGVLQTVCGIEAKQLGNDKGVATTIELSSDLETTAEYLELAEKIASHAKVCDLLQLHLGAYAANPARIQLLRGEHQQKMRKMHEKLESVKKSLAKLGEQRDEFLLLQRRNPVARVNFLKTLFPGVVIRAVDQTFSVSEPLSGPLTLAYLIDSHSFEKRPMEGLECAVIPAEE